MSAVARNAAGVSRLTWTAGLVLGASLPHWSSLPLWMPLMLGACIAWRFAARLARWPLPGRWLMRAITVAALSGVLLEFRTINGLVPGSALLMVMVSLKFLEAKTQRDHIMLTVIAYFLVFASLLSSGGLLKGIYLIAFVWLTTLGLLQVGRQGALLSNGPTARLAGKLLLQAVPLMIVLFLLFPRLPGPLWALPGNTSSGATGLSESMSPGDITNLGLSDEIAFRVEFSGELPATSELYWRGPVLANFDGRSWTRRSGTTGRQLVEFTEYLGNVSRYRVMLDPDSHGWAFALDMPQSWDLEDRRPTLRMGSDYQLGIWPAELADGRLNYTVTSYSQYRATEPLRPEEQAFFRLLPEDSNPRTRRLMADLLQDSPDVATIVERSLDVFRSEGFFYTLTPPPLGEHTADEFIFDTQEGFCEHYASAFTIMMRMAGIPARVVTGYQGGELNPLGDYHIIRQSDAHAWTEIWTAADGWVRVDPISAVAPERIAFGSLRNNFSGAASVVQRIGRMTLLRQMALAWDSVNTAWNDWVVGYGPRLQRNLLEKLGIERPRWRELMVMTVVATTLMMVALTLFLGLRMRRWEKHDPAAKTFARFTRNLRQYDVLPLKRGETASAYARRATAVLPAAADSIRSITQTYLAARYEPDNGAALERLRAEVRAFRPDYARGSQ